MPLFDLGDLLDDLAAAGEQVNELLVNAINLFAESVEAGFGRRGLRGLAGLRVF